MLVRNTVLAFSATVSTFWVTAVALATWCNAQILLDGPVFACETEKIRRTGRKKNVCIFGAQMFTVYVKHPLEAVDLFQSVMPSEIRLAFSRSVWKGLNTIHNTLEAFF